MTVQPGEVPPPSIIQLTSVPAGRLSLKRSVVAVPAVLLVSVTVKPICDPVTTGSASAVLLMLTLGTKFVYSSAPMSGVTVFRTSLSKSFLMPLSGSANVVGIGVAAAIAGLPA